MRISDAKIFSYSRKMETKTQNNNKKKKQDRTERRSRVFTVMTVTTVHLFTLAAELISDLYGNTDVRLKDTDSAVISNKEL